MIKLIYKAIYLVAGLLLVCLVFQVLGFFPQIGENAVIPVAAHESRQPAAAIAGSVIAETSITMSEIRRCSLRDARIVQEMAQFAPVTVVQSGQEWSAIAAAKSGGGWSAYSDDYGNGTCWWASLAREAVSGRLPITEEHKHYPYYAESCPRLVYAIEEEVIANGAVVVSDFRFQNNTGRPIVVVLEISGDTAYFRVFNQ